MIGSLSRKFRWRSGFRRKTLAAVLGLGTTALLVSAPTTPAVAVASVYAAHGFTAATYGGISPGDPDLAVGPTYIVETINTSMTVFNKLGHQTSHREFSALFAPATSVFCVDPRVIYWSWDNRYAIICSDIGSNQTIRIAVSASSNPNGSWSTWTTGPNTAVDQPNVEVTKDKLVVGGSTVIGGVSSSVFHVYQKADLLVGAKNPRVRFLSTPRGQYQAVKQLTETSPAYSVQAYPGGNDLFLATIAGTPATTVSLVITDLGAYPLASPNEPGIPGGGLGRGYLDGRVTSAAYEVTSARVGIIQFSGMAECGTKVCNSNGEITLAKTGPVKSYVKTFGESSYDDTYGAITLDRVGRAYEVYSRSNVTSTPQAAIVTPGFRTVIASSVPGTTACHTGVLPPCYERWGDYLGATQDPINPKKLWFVGLYQTSSGDDGWTTEIASVTVS
jgi:hypothetical protein